MAFSTSLIPIGLYGLLQEHLLFYNLRLLGQEVNTQFCFEPWTFPFLNRYRAYGLMGILLLRKPQLILTLIRATVAQWV
jgi:hypothetical protein